jgi:hypothetical protein
MYFDEPEVPSATNTPVCVALERRVVVDAAKLTVSEFDAVLLFPGASVNLLAVTDTVPVPDVFPDAVNVTFRDVPDVVSAESEPRVTLKSSRVRLLVVSLRAIAMVHVEPETYDAEHPDRAMVGPVASRVIVVDAVAAEEGPVFPATSTAPFNAKRGMTVPSPQPETVTVRVEPESVPGLNEHVKAVPVFEKSPDATSVTDSENCSAYVNVAAFVGEDWVDEKELTVGATESLEKVIVRVEVNLGKYVVLLPAPPYSAT